MPIHKTRPTLIRVGIPRSDINRAKRLFAAGESVADIATRLMTTEACVASHVGAEEKPKKTEPKEKKEPTKKKEA